jgi:lipopolysaccharide biosynthesis regulator YciM
MKTNIISDIRNIEQIIQDTKEAIIYWQDDPAYVDWLRNELSKCYAKLNKLEQSTCQ